MLQDVALHLSPICKWSLPVHGTHRMHRATPSSTLLPPAPRRCACRLLHGRSLENPPHGHPPPCVRTTGSQSPHCTPVHQSQTHRGFRVQTLKIPDLMRLVELLQVANSWRRGSPCDFRLAAQLRSWTLAENEPPKIKEARQGPAPSCDRWPAPPASLLGAAAARRHRSRLLWLLPAAEVASRRWGPPVGQLPFLHPCQHRGRGLGRPGPCPGLLAPSAPGGWGPRRCGSCGSSCGPVGDNG